LFGADDYPRRLFRDKERRGQKVSKPLPWLWGGKARSPRSTRCQKSRSVSRRKRYVTHSNAPIQKETGAFWFMASTRAEKIELAACKNEFNHSGTIHPRYLG
jgi:hypothetical protein